MSDKTTTTTATGRGSIRFCELLAVLFIGLKLTGVIAWSWWWVLAPLWGPLALVLAIIAVVGIAFLIFLLIGALFGGKRR